MIATFPVFEIEHGEDVNVSVEDLRRAGCWRIEVLSVDYATETMTVRCQLPAGCENPKYLALEVAIL